MNINFFRFRWLIAILSLTFLLAACERALQQEPDTTVTAPATLPTLDPGMTPLAPPPAASPTIEGVAPTPEEGATETSPPPEGGEAEATAAPAPEGEGLPPEDIIHTIVAGDTLGRIADQYGVTVEAIAAANNLTNIHDLDVGEQLIIPLSGEVGSGAPEPTTEERVHIVQAGDTLYRIGLAYGFTIEDLTAYNNLANPNDLDVGQQILIPPDGYSAP